jgi:CRP-like cAMP-binding protein
MAITWVEASGYIAALLVFSTFYMKTMIPLRTIAIASNVAFMTYAFAARLYPVLLLHAVLLPLNALRLYQMRRVIDRVRRASDGGFSVEGLLPYMTRRASRAQDVLFRQGDEADHLYYIQSGSVRIVELAVTLGPGEVFGEIGAFSPTGTRMATAVCETDSVFLVLSIEVALQLYFQNPEFGLYLVRMVTRRLLEDRASPGFVPSEIPPPSRPHRIRAMDFESRLARRWRRRGPRPG